MLLLSSETMPWLHTLISLHCTLLCFLGCIVQSCTVCTDLKLPFIMQDFSPTGFNQVSNWFPSSCHKGGNLLEICKRPSCFSTMLKSVLKHRSQLGLLLGSLLDSSGQLKKCSFPRCLQGQL